MRIEDLIEKDYIAKVKVDKQLVDKELKEAKYDLDRAEVALKQNDTKWCIIKAYYSMFHAARAVLFSMGLKERRHFVIGIVLDRLSRDGKLESKYINDFRAAMSSREDADYRYVYSSDTATYIVDIAEEFLDRMKKLIK
jgi:uncharacterized protein (UPF0332 family)